MKKTIFTILILLLPTSLSAQWAIKMGGTNTDQGKSMVVDESGNTYITGNFQGTADFDPGNGIYNLISNGAVDIYLAKYAPDGSFIWAKNIGGVNIDVANSIAIDGSGNLIITGYFRSTVDFDPGNGTYNLSSIGQDDVFFAKYSPDGSLIWAKSFGGTSYDIGKSIFVDGSGNIYITGYFEATADFDPGPGTHTIINNSGGRDIYIAKYASDGSFIWANGFGNTPWDFGNSIAADGNGNSYITGVFEGTVDFDPGAGIHNLTSNGSADIFFAKYSSDGSFIWAANFGGTSSDYGESVFIDGSGNLYITGGFQGTADFDPSGVTQNLTSAGNLDIFFAKYSSDGSLIWANRVGGTDSDFGSSLVVDGNGNSYITGAFRDTVDFDHGSGTSNLISNGNYDIFFAKYAPNGNFIWANGMGGTSIDQGNSIAIDESGNIFVAGNFKYTVDFDPGIGTFNLTAGGSTGSDDIFIAKYLPDGLLTDVDEIDNNIPIAFELNQNYPNPFNPSTKIRYTIPNVTLSGVEGSRVQLKIYDVLGNEVATLVDENKSAGSYEVNFDAEGLTSGIYFYKLQAGSFVQTKKMILIK